MHIGHARVEFLIQEIIELTHVRYCYCEAKVHSSSVIVVNVVCLCIVFFEGSPSKEGFHGTHGTPLDLPLLR